MAHAMFEEDGRREGMVEGWKALPGKPFCLLWLADHSGTRTAIRAARKFPFRPKLSFLSVFHLYSLTSQYKPTAVPHSPKTAFQRHQ